MYKQCIRSCIFRWRCENCGDDKLTSPAHVMRLLLKVEADINQSDDVQKNEVCKNRTSALLSSSLYGWFELAICQV